MRVEAITRTLRTWDRRTRTLERRAGEERRTSDRSERRARHTTQPWMFAPFGAHLLGQAAPETASAESIVRAYAQPETRTPLRPRFVRRA